jgi:hypothetical protein
MKKLYYTYKVTFPGLPWFYYGYHRDNGKPYFGSPSTHKWIWDFYECEIQILEWFETREEALSVEQRLIRPFLNDPFCLNEACGGQPSGEARKRGASQAGKNQPKEVKRQNGLKSQEVHRQNGTGVFCRDNQIRAAQISAEVYGGFRNLGEKERKENSKKANEIQKERKTGRFSSEHQRRLALLPKSEEGMEKIREAGRKNKGKKFWNNGRECVRALECPGEGWVQGQPYKWWNNGEEETKSIESPGEGWSRGRVKV